MKVSSDVAKELLDLQVGGNTKEWGYGDNEEFPVNFEMVQSELVDTSRWSNIHEVVYKDLDSGKFYSSTYSVGATECQDESPYENDGDEIEFTEVVPKEVIEIEYVPA